MSSVNFSSAIGKVSLPALQWRTKQRRRSKYGQQSSVNSKTPELKAKDQQISELEQNAEIIRETGRAKKMSGDKFCPLKSKVKLQSKRVYKEDPISEYERARKQRYRAKRKSDKIDCLQ